MLAHPIKYVSIHVTIDMHTSVCMSVHAFVHMSVHMSMHMYTHVHAHTYPDIMNMAVRVSIHMSTYMPMYVSPNVYAHMPILVSVYMSIQMSTHTKDVYIHGKKVRRERSDGGIHGQPGIAMGSGRTFV